MMGKVLFAAIGPDDAKYFLNLITVEKSIQGMHP